MLGENVVCVVDARGIAESIFQGGVDAERAHEGLPELVYVRGGAIIRETADHVGGLDQRIVRAIRHRAVARRPRDTQAPPGHALLADVHGDVQLAAVRGHEAAVLGQEIVRAERIPVTLAHVPGPEQAPRFLVGAGEVDEGAPRPPAALGQRLERDRLRGGEVQHVHRAPSPHLALHELACEGIARPRRGRHGHHVGMAHQAEGGRGGIAPLDTGHEARASRRPVGFVDLEVEAAPFEVGPEEIGGAHLLSGFDGAVVHALIADHLLEELDGLSGQGVVHGWPP